MVAAGASHSVLLRSDGQVVACGANDHCQCDILATLPWLQYTAVAAGKSHTALLQSDGQAVARGDNCSGQCDIPALPPGLRYVQVAAGGTHTVLLRSDRRAAACGLNDAGQCELPEPPAGGGFAAVAAGGWHSVLLSTEGELACCGLNNYGQCSPPAPPPACSYSAAAAGTFHSVALRDDGQVVACGLNNHGQLDVPALPAGARYAAVAAGSFHTVLLRDDGEAVAFGHNGEGQCDVPAPPAGTRYVAVAAGGLHTVLLRDDGGAATCGPNCNGQCDIPEPGAGLRYVASAACEFDSAPPNAAGLISLPILDLSGDGGKDPLGQMGVEPLSTRSTTAGSSVAECKTATPGARPGGSPVPPLPLGPEPGRAGPGCPSVPVSNPPAMTPRPRCRTPLAASASTSRCLRRLPPSPRSGLATARHAAGAALVSDVRTSEIIALAPDTAQGAAHTAPPAAPVREVPEEIESEGSVTEELGANRLDEVGGLEEDVPEELESPQPDAGGLAARPKVPKVAKLPKLPTRAWSPPLSARSHWPGASLSPAASISKCLPRRPVARA